MEKIPDGASKEVAGNFEVGAFADRSRDYSARVSALIIKHSSNILNSVKRLVELSSTSKERIEQIDKGIENIQRISDISAHSHGIGGILSHMQVWSGIIKIEAMLFEPNEHSVNKIKRHIHKLLQDLEAINFDEFPYDTFLGNVENLCDYINELSQREFANSLPLQKLLASTSTKVYDLIRIKKQKAESAKTHEKIYERTNSDDSFVFFPEQGVASDQETPKERKESISDTFEFINYPLSKLNEEECYDIIPEREYTSLGSFSKKNTRG